MRKIRSGFLVFVFCLLSIGCFHIEPRHIGLIKDADTQKPLKDVIVFLELCYYPPFSLDTSSCHYYGYQETSSDTNGNFNLSPGFHPMPPFLCITGEPTMHFFKIGYFSKRNGVEKLDGDINLYKMDYYLNYLQYKLDDPHYISSHYGDNFEEHSKLIHKTNLKYMKHLNFEPADEIGVFFRSPGRKFTKINSTFEGDYSDPLFTNRIIFVYDESVDEWICLDSRGKIIDLKKFSSKDRRKIPALPGTYRSAFEIENGGNSICKNTSRERVSRQLAPSLINPPLSCFTGKDLPSTNEDDSLKYSKFIYSASPRSRGYFVVTKTPKLWHVYKFEDGYDNTTKTVKMNIKHLLSFPNEKEIMGLTASGNDFFLVFKNEGIRKYRLDIETYGYSFKEDKSFFINSSRIGKLNINSISFGSTVNMTAIYATTGDDKIYRFSEADGTPDYIVKPSNID